jgi:hypothetical protein
LPTVVERDGRYKLIAGRHRVEALRVIGEDPIDVRVADFDDIEARLWTISENLHRNELRALDRDEQIAEWIRLSEQRRSAGAEQALHSDAAPSEVSSQVATKLSSRGRDGEGRPESGVRAAGRELGVGKDDAHRAVKVDSIIPEGEGGCSRRRPGPQSNRPSQGRLLSRRRPSGGGGGHRQGEVREGAICAGPRQATARPRRHKRRSACPLDQADNASGQDARHPRSADGCRHSRRCKQE